VEGSGVAVGEGSLTGFSSAGGEGVDVGTASDADKAPDWHPVDPNVIKRIAISTSAHLTRC
jgi:hypothetical protein